MRKYPFEESLSDNCIDANSKMVEGRDTDNFPRLQPQEWSTWTMPEIALRIYLRTLKRITRIKSFISQTLRMSAR